MDWYAVQVITGKEQQVAAALRDSGVETLAPQTPMIFRFSQKLKLENRLLLPGYVIARMDEVDFFRYQREPRVERMMIRICGNMVIGRERFLAVPLNEDEVEFLRNCCLGLPPLCLDDYHIVNPPPWAARALIDKYDAHQFRARLHLQTGRFLNDHRFNIAAYPINYNGFYRNQLQDLLHVVFGASDATECRLSQEVVQAGASLHRRGEAIPS